MIALILAAVVAASPSPSPFVKLPTPSPIAGGAAVVAEQPVRASLPCALLAYEANLKGRKPIPLTDGLGRLWSASLELHARIEGTKLLTQRQFLEATADVMNCVSWGDKK